MIGTLLAMMLQSAAGAVPAQADDDSEALEPISVTGQRVANLQPASTFGTLATSLRYDPQVDLQARGLPEGQADITVRGGIFENTGFSLGAVSIFDPQTGHYSVEIPLDPGMLSSAELLTDFANGLNTFNASVATVQYGFMPVTQGVSVSAGIGTDSLRYATASASHRRELDNGDSLGATISIAGSSGDGTLPDGDHDFKRFSGHLQVSGQDRETNLLLGYHDKFFGWPGAYTGFASLPETDHTRLGLVVLDHRWSDQNGWWEIGSAYRWLKDDYDFDRRTQESGQPGSFEHETRSFSLGLKGRQQAAGLDWLFSGQLVADRLVRSTDLTNGTFNSRTYLSMSLAPEHEWALGSGNTLLVHGGLRLDVSNRDEDALMPLFGVVYERPVTSGLNRFELQYSRTSQLPGYTALNSRPTGLFGGNPYLGREYANTLSLGFTHEADDWQIRTSVFRRHDDDLVDWTYRQDAPFSRQANPVDLDVTGLEGMVSWHSQSLDIIGAYTWIHKNADYASAQVDASFYALNYAKHRLTLALVYRPVAQLEFRMDNEYRAQQENLLRSGKDTAYITSLSLSWRLPVAIASYLRLIGDNLTDSTFQEFPGTPPMGRQISLGIGMDW